MAAKKKKSLTTGGSEPECDKEKEAEMHREYKAVTETLNNLKRRAEQLRRDNDFLQNEANQMTIEHSEYLSFMSKRLQKRQNAIATLRNKSQQELEELRRQRAEMQEKHEERTKVLGAEILDKESELSLLNLEINKLREIKKKQLARVAELEQEVENARIRRAESGRALKNGFLTEKERYDSQAKLKVQELTIAVNKEASRCLQEETQQVFEENQYLRKELRQLVQKTTALRTHQKTLHKQRSQLLIEIECLQKLQPQCTSTEQETQETD